MIDQFTAKQTRMNNKVVNTETNITLVYMFKVQYVVIPCMLCGNPSNMPNYVINKSD